MIPSTPPGLRDGLMPQASGAGVMSSGAGSTSSRPRARRTAASCGTGCSSRTLWASPVPSAAGRTSGMVSRPGSGWTRQPCTSGCWKAMWPRTRTKGPASHYHPYLPWTRQQAPSTTRLLPLTSRSRGRILNLGFARTNILSTATDPKGKGRCKRSIRNI